MSHPLLKLHPLPSRPAIAALRKERAFPVAWRTGRIGRFVAFPSPSGTAAGAQLRTWKLAQNFVVISPHVGFNDAASLARATRGKASVAARRPVLASTGKPKEARMDFKKYVMKLNVLMSKT